MDWMSLIQENVKQLKKHCEVISSILSCLHSSASSLLCIFPLVLAKSFSTAFSTTVKNVLAIFVHFQLHNGNLTGVDTNINSGTVGFLPLNPLNVDPELGPVALDNLPNLLPLVVTPNHLHLVVLPHWHGPHTVLGAQLLGQRSGH